MTTSQLRRVVQSFRDDILGGPRSGNESRGMCFAVCAPLQGFLCFCGIQSKLVQQQFQYTNHVWLELPDGSIIDPTADQFLRLRLPPVYIGPLPRAYKRWSARWGHVSRAIGKES